MYSDNVYWDKPDGPVITSYKQEQVLIPATQWADLTFNELMEQKSLLFSRWEFLVQTQNPIAKEFQVFVENIDAAITKRLSESMYSLPKTNAYSDK